MNIVYINHYAGGPKYGMEYRPFYLAREWSRMGHRVMILAGSFSHVRARQPEPPVGRATARWSERVDGLEYVWYRTRGYTGNGLGRATNIASFLFRVALDADRTISEFNPDVVIASSTYPMDIWVARRMAGKAKARLVFELHDLWPLSPIELGGMSSHHPFVHLCKAAERIAYRDADVVVSMLPNVAGYLQDFGLTPERLHIVPNGFSPDDWVSPAQELAPDILEFVDRQRACSRLVVCYAGSHGLPNALDVLLDAAIRLRQDSFAFVLVGDGMEKPLLAARAEAAGLDRFRMFAPIPKAQIPSLLAIADIAYIGWRRSPLYRFGIAPNKLLDYMMSGRPVLHSVEASNDPVAESNCGLTVEPGSAEAVAEGLRRMAAMPPEVREEMGRRGRAYALEQHAYPVLARRFLNALGEVAT